MPRPSSGLSDLLTRRYQSLEATRKRIEALATAGRLSRRATGHMYEGLFLSAFTAFETFLEELFVGHLSSNRLRSVAYDVVPRVTVRSAAIARELIVGPGRSYADWLPYKRTQGRAELFFRGGRPFSEVKDAAVQPLQQVLERAVLLRNVIAHRSRYSLTRFEQDVVRGIPLAPRERTPAGFLRSITAATPPQTRYETYVTSLLTLARHLAR